LGPRCGTALWPEKKKKKKGKEKEKKKPFLKRSLSF
jgi:hypothetical protein